MLNRSKRHPQNHPFYINEWNKKTQTLVRSEMTYVYAYLHIWHLYSYGGFLSHRATPKSSSIFMGFSLTNKPTSYWRGTPMASWKPCQAPRGDPWRPCWPPWPWPWSAERRWSMAWLGDELALEETPPLVVFLFGDGSVVREATVKRLGEHWNGDLTKK